MPPPPPPRPPHVCPAHNATVHHLLMEGPPARCKSNYPPAPCRRRGGAGGRRTKQHPRSSLGTEQPPAYDTQHTKVGLPKATISALVPTPPSRGSGDWLGLHTKRRHGDPTDPESSVTWASFLLPANSLAQSSAPTQAHRSEGVSPPPPPRALLEGGGAPPSPPNALPTTLPEGTSTTPIPPPRFSNRQ